jgi:hypothetical protein
MIEMTALETTSACVWKYFTKEWGGRYAADLGRAAQAVVHLAAAQAGVALSQQLRQLQEGQPGWAQKHDVSILDQKGHRLVPVQIHLEETQIALESGWDSFLEECLTHCTIICTIICRR